MNTRIHTVASVGLTGVLATAALLAMPARAAAQYFGRNKVQYETFDFRTMRTQHFDMLYYPAESLATADAARMAERWYARHSATMHAQFSRRSIVLYADAPDFQQTNVVGGFISQGTGGVTEGLQSRVVLPFTGVYAEDDHVLGHEMVHVFQYDIAGQSKTGMAGLDRLPLWLIEGMAEYLSLGRNDPNTAMWLRDAVLHKHFPTIKQLSTDPRFFPYRYGEALWAYIGGRWGDDVIPVLYRAAIERGWEESLRSVLGVSSDTLSRQWRDATAAAYLPTTTGRSFPDSVGTELLRPTKSEQGDMDVAPALSPDGKYVAFYTSRGLFSIDLYVADAETGKIVKKLTGPNSDQHFDAISFINSSGTWSPDGRRFAFVVYANGDNEIDIFDVGSKRIVDRIHPRGIGAINNVAWSPDGRQLAFSGQAGGVSDLYLWDLSARSLRQLTRDRYADLQPAWSPDGREIAFATDRGPATDFGKLSYGPVRLAIMDVASGEIRLLSDTSGAKQINPQFSPDGRDLYFISDRGGVNDIYRMTLATGEMYQITRIATGVSGITALSPALSVASQNGRLMFSVFERGGYDLHRLEQADARGVALTGPSDTTTVAGMLPPPNIPGGGLVTQRVADATTGLPPEESLPTGPVKSGLSLQYLGSPGVGVGVSSFGVVAGGGVAAYFSDLLGNHVVGAQISGGGDIRNFGGEAIYQDLTHRWNWGVGISHIPFLSGIFGVKDTVVDVQGGQLPAQVIEEAIQRTYYDQAQLTTQYPLSMTRRFELSAGYTRISFGGTLDRFLTIGNQVVASDQSGLPGAPAINLGQATAAYVGDYSSFGFTSPVAGARYRFEWMPTFGDLNYQGVLADYRRYFLARPITFAFRGIHYARYGSGGEDPRLSQLFVGDPQLVRGYDPNSFDGSECGTAAAVGSCPVFDRLLGSRLAVANAEIRIPLLGTREFGLINFPYLATEIAPFFDAGVAWTSEQGPDWTFSRNSAARVPVFSTGVSARFNVLGYAVLEVYWAYPFQRPGKGGQFGFQLAPGW
ncbi:MAG TPA: BamA/TamA family outer membrane protein [Gemmatimonadaceae bacterium]|nr:BamA/TamA family outer membrane protein [Gemmatimonadaceae bacterium]